jgi:hypothetical protein
MTEEQLQESIGAHRECNAPMRQMLSGRGGDLSEQRPIDVHFWAWTQRDAAVLGRELFKKGFLVKLLSPSPTPDDED